MEVIISENYSFTLKWSKLIEELKSHSHNFKQSTYKIFITAVVFTSIPYSIKKIINSILKQNAYPLLNKNFLLNSGIEETDYIKVINNLGKMKTKEYHYSSINNHFNQTIFGTMDRSTSSFNIEHRYPFFDKRLIEFCYSIPTEMKIKNGWDRYVMRIAMENILPPEIQWRHQKANLSHIYKRNLILFEKNTLKKIIQTDKKIFKKFIDIKIIQTIFKNYESENGQNLFGFWLVTLLYFWINSKDNLNSSAHPPKKD